MHEISVRLSEKGEGWIPFPFSREKIAMKMIVLVDWSDDQSKMPEKPACTHEALQRGRRVMKSFEYWRRKRKKSHQLVLWHTHFPERFTRPPEIPEGQPDPFDCRANLLEKQIEAVTKNYNPDEPILLADDSFVFTDEFDLERLAEQAMRPGSGIVLAPNAWILNPGMQRVLGNLDGDPDGERFEKDWTEDDFVDWAYRTTWTFAKTYAEKAPHEYAALGKPNTELFDLYKATMFILHNGYVEMFYQTPFMSYTVEKRRYWTYSSYDLVNRTLEGDLKTYK